MGQDEEFAAFWAAYPRRVGKFDALKAYSRARAIASAGDILAGVARYVTLKPDYADWCHPGTWLRQGRWMDEPDTVAAQPVKHLGTSARTAGNVTAAHVFLERVAAARNVRS